MLIINYRKGVRMPYKETDKYKYKRIFVNIELWRLFKEQAKFEGKTVTYLLNEVFLSYINMKKLEKG